MDEVLLQEGDVKALFAPHRGMNLLSLKFGDIEVIDQSTKGLFEERSAGLGSMIGPHFHRRKEEIIPKHDLSQFSQINRAGPDPFSHGIGRYAPWSVSLENNKIKAVLKGSDVWNGVKLSDLEGQDFTMTYEAGIERGGLEIMLSVVSQTDSLVGIHFYYHAREGVVTSCTKEDHHLNFSLAGETDTTFHPHPDPLKGEILLKTREYALKTTYESSSSENSWQLWRPKESYVCIEPISSYDPRHPNLTVSSIKIRLELANT